MTAFVETSFNVSGSYQGQKDIHLPAEGKKGATIKHRDIQEVVGPE